MLLPRNVSLPTAIALVVASSFISVVFKAHWRAHTSDNSLDEDISSGKQVEQGQSEADAASYMQGKVLVSHLQDQHRESSVPSVQMPKKTSDSNPAVPMLKKASDSTTGSDGAHGELRALESVRQHLKGFDFSSLALSERYRAGSQGAGSTLMVVILIGCMIFFMFLMLMASRRLDERRQMNGAQAVAKQDSPYQQLPPGSSSAGFLQEVGVNANVGSSSILRSENRLSPQPSPLTSMNAGMSPKPPDNMFNLSPWSPLRPHTSPMGSMAQPMSASMAPQFPIGSNVLSSVGSLLDSTQNLLAADRRLPPPLCPNVVLPNCEVRVGVPMHELGKISSEGELTIVGLSGNALLRAALRKAEGGRTLEISMPEPRSAPRAVVGPSIQDSIAPDKTRSRAVRICGMKGAFYGMLEMRSTGACYVIKDGQTVLIIDGDSESLQLAIKSGQGAPLAAVTCSSEPFGGAEHLEIRVQPGVDTVLVLACVLSVVLLSPYPASES